VVRVGLDTVEKVLTDGSSGLPCRCGWAGDRLRWVARGAKRTAPPTATVNSGHDRSGWLGSVGTVGFGFYGAGMNVDRAVSGDGLGGWDPALIDQVVRRVSSPGYTEWWDRVQASGYCARPVHLVGVDGFGRQREVLGRCKNRRASVCPSCSDLYAGDTWQLIHAGLAGGHHEVPATVAEHPAVFATLTAPGFGAVHTTSNDPGSNSARGCHSACGGWRCPHGNPLGCRMIHEEMHPVLGEPLCPDCYDYTGHVLFSWHAPELWRRFSIGLRRLVARALRGMGEDPRVVRVSFVKVVELQRRGVPHFHAVIRLDAATPAGEELAAPTTGLTAIELGALVHQAVAAATLDVTGPDGTRRCVRFGEQTDAQPLRPHSTVDSVDSGGGEVEPVGIAGRAVAGYLAKYVTKSVAEFGLTPHRMSPLAIDTLAVREHVRAILTTVRDLAALPEYAAMLGWLHTLGFRGHITTKSRSYSTTMGALRARRAAWHTTRSTDTAVIAAPSIGDPPSPGAVAGAQRCYDAVHRGVPGEWLFDHVGHGSEGERVLAISAATRARDQRFVARAEYAELLHAERVAGIDRHETTCTWAA